MWIRGTSGVVLRPHRGQLHLCHWQTYNPACGQAKSKLKLAYSDLIFRAMLSLRPVSKFSISRPRVVLEFLHSMWLTYKFESSAGFSLNLFRVWRKSLWRKELKQALVRNPLWADSESVHWMILVQGQLTHRAVGGDSAVVCRLVFLAKEEIYLIVFKLSVAPRLHPNCKYFS